MEIKKRSPILYKLTKQQKKWLHNGCCPICGLPKSKWERRTDWRCCSTKCTKKFSEIVVFIWQYFKEDAFKRDNYKCVKCGFAPKRETWEKKIVPDTSKLIGDHIIPIAVGGEEYDLDNVQTLCEKCNKIKTKKDLREIAIFRKKHPSQKILSNSSPPVRTSNSTSLTSDKPKGFNMNLITRYTRPNFSYGKTELNSNLNSKHNNEA